jgi:predicted metal-binding protein
MTRAVLRRPTPWKTVVLLCGKCARKFKGGYGPKGKDPLRLALRTALKDAGHRREVRIIETRCMGVCPKRAVTMLNASRPDTLCVVPAGTAMEEIMPLIGGPASAANGAVTNGSAGQPS